MTDRHENERASPGLPTRRAVLTFPAVLAAASTTTAITDIQSAPSKFKLGVDVLTGLNFKPILGKRVGLLTHPAGVNGKGESTIDVLRRAPNVKLVALYGPEHGIYGDEKANVPVLDKIDKRTGLPVFSLYGKYRKPTPDMLKKIDCLVVDLQDVGVRSYTYVSCMRYAMEACFENNVEMIILDRPNPLSGMKVDGPPLDKQFMSYVGAFQVPYVHGLTIGELANLAKKTPNALATNEFNRRRGQVRIIPMAGWRRSMFWPQTGLKWKATSPYIPDLSAVLGYPMTGLGAQMGGFRHGIGTEFPFRFLTFRGKPLNYLKETMDARKIPGISFQPKLDRKGNKGLYVKVDNWKIFRPTELSFHMMQQSCIWMENPFAKAESGPALLFNKHVGSQEWWDAITTYGAKVNLHGFLSKWQKESRAFQQYSRQFWIYNTV